MPRVARTRCVATPRNPTLPAEDGPRSPAPTWHRTPSRPHRSRDWSWLSPWDASEGRLFQPRRTPARELELGEPRVGRDQTLLARAEVDKHRDVGLNAYHGAEAVTVVGHPVVQLEPLDGSGHRRDVEGTTGQRSPDHGVVLFITSSINV